MRIFRKIEGFTLIELMVSVAITAFLMLGVAAFFSNTFRNMFATRDKVANSHGQFVVSTILNGKFLNTSKVESPLVAGQDHAVIRNDMDQGELPFTYIGRDTAASGIGHVVFKDFFVFNGRHGSETSADSPIVNPGGITVVNDMFYITSPLENKIYKCNNIGCTTKNELNIPDLNQPMGLAADDPGNTLYATDAKNGRVLMITNLDDPSSVRVTSVATGLNYPTGIAFYTANRVNYLFVAETYSSLVKRITLGGPYPTSSIETVVGDGDDTDCNSTPAREHTAYFCKLHFPTDVMIGTEGVRSYLYIADTGNGRVLRVSDPAPDLSNLKLPLTLPSNTQVSRIEFVLPNGSRINSVKEGTTSNSLHPVIYSSNGTTTVTASLTVQTNGNLTSTSCTGGPPPVCTTYFKGFTVDSANAIFVSGDKLDIGGRPYTVASVSGNDVYVNPNTDILIPPVPSSVRITNKFSSGNYDFYLDLSDAILPGGFNKIQVTAYDENGSAIVSDPPDSATVRMGDGTLGTFEDIISVFSSGLDFPTGLGWTGGGAQISDSPNFTLNFPNYDYTSDFLIKDLRFDESNSNSVLNMDFKADLGKDSQGNDQWQDYSLSSSLNP